jgi:ribose 5-phosphate isomerase A
MARIANEIATELENVATLGLGSGSTIANLLAELSKIKDLKMPKVIPTSIQIQIVAENLGFEIGAFFGRVDSVIDGADQIDDELNLIKGGGGALLKEKVLMSSCRSRIIIADEGKFASKLCMNSVKVPVEVYPFARESVKRKIIEIGGDPKERLLPKGYPYFTENGNVILDTAFEPITNPKDIETQVKEIAGVLEVGIFTIKPMVAYKIKRDGSFDRKSSRM